MNVRDVMTSEVATVGIEASIKDVGRLLREREVSGVRMVDRDRRLRGVVTEADVVAMMVGTKDRAAITSAVLATRDFDGLLGRWSFDSNGDVDLRRATRLTVRDGDFTYLEVREVED